MPRLWPYAFKNRLIVMLVFSALVPLVLIGSISYVSMHSMLEHKAERGVRTNLRQVRLSLENTLGQLNHVSQQLAFDGRVGKNLEQYLLARSYEKRRLQDDIRSQLNLIHFTNPSVGLMFYFFAGTNEYMFENFPVDDKFGIDKLPMLDTFKDITYYGPHPSLAPLLGNKVLSIVRRIDLPEREDVYVYIETSFKLAETIIGSEPFDAEAAHLIVDHDGTVTFSENVRDFPIGSAYDRLSAERNIRGNYVLFEESGNQTWKIVSAIPQAAYEREIRGWIRQFTLFTLLSLGISALIAWTIRRSLYKPLRAISQDIRNVKNNRLRAPLGKSGMLEFDMIHAEFAHMRHRISELIADAELREKNKARMEVEKLTHQINPHFIYNTLDTVRWLARMNGQGEIDEVVSSMYKVLRYNLGKSGPATIRQEIDNLRNYAKLQGIRYRFAFDVRIRADEGLLDVPVPRFVLQPLVENSLFHGLGDDGAIEVSVVQEGEGFVCIAVSDNGRGMTEVEIGRALTDEPQKKGLGIGLHYVRRMIQIEGGPDAELRIDSRLGSGTTFRLKLPIPIAAPGPDGSRRDSIPPGSADGLKSSAI